MKLDTRRIGLFLLFAFGIAWAVGLWVYLNGGLVNSPVLIPNTNFTIAVVVIAFGYMWAPALANILTRLVTKEGWKDVGLRGNLRAGWPAWVAAWFLPAILTFLGAGIYFVLFPQYFDPTLGTLRQMLEFVEQQTGEAIPLSPQILLVVQLAQGILLAPLLNGFFTFGEEFGWRAYLQPKLMALGFRKALLLLGVIWGLWHAPVIAMGHNYGFGYPGAPWTGILAMTFFTITVGIVFGWLTLRAGSVWPAVIAHGALNGIAGTGMLFLSPGLEADLLLGPLPVGLIGGIPWVIAAAYLFWKGAPAQPANVSRETLPRKGASPKGAMIYAKGLTKSFGDVVAVDGLDIDVAAGEIFGLLGPNGAGKTTTIRMLAALIVPSSGEAWVAGHQVGFDDNALRKSVGVLTETPGLYEQLSAERNLRFFAELYDVENVSAQVERYLQMLGLWGRRHDSVGTFSKGMRQKLAIARSLLHEPRVLFLDEPTSGLDPEAAHLVRDFVGELRSEGRAIILCTHNLDEADRLCDRIAVLSTKLLAVDTPVNLRRNLFSRSVVFHLTESKGPFADAVRQKSYVHETKLIENKLVVTLDEPEIHNPELVRELVGMGAGVQFVGELRRSLEDVYLELVGNDKKEVRP